MIDLNRLKRIIVCGLPASGGRVFRGRSFSLLGRRMRLVMERVLPFTGSPH